MSTELVNKVGYEDVVMLRCHKSDIKHMVSPSLVMTCDVYDSSSIIRPHELHGDNLVIHPSAAEKSARVSYDPYGNVLTVLFQESVKCTVVSGIIDCE